MGWESLIDWKEGKPGMVLRVSGGRMMPVVEVDDLMEKASEASLMIMVWAVSFLVISMVY